MRRLWRCERTEHLIMIQTWMRERMVNGKLSRKKTTHALKMMQGNHVFCKAWFENVRVMALAALAAKLVFHWLGLLRRRSLWSFVNGNRPWRGFVWSYLNRASDHRASKGVSANTHEIGDEMRTRIRRSNGSSDDVVVFIVAVIKGNTGF